MIGIGLILASVSMLVGWFLVNYLWAQINLRRYKQLLHTITPEEVQKRAQWYMPWNPERNSEPPLFSAWREIVRERIKEWVKTNKLSPLFLDEKRFPR